MQERPDFPKRPAWLVTMLALLVFFVLDHFDGALFKRFAADTEGWTRTAAWFTLRYLPWLFATLGLAALLFGVKNTAYAVGLHRIPLRGVLIAAVGTAPMLAALAFTSSVAPLDGMGRSVVQGALLPGFFEEIFYRSLLFGFLFRFAGWGFLPAALLGAVIFGGAHLYQSGEPAAAAAIFAITATGAGWFAWLYAEWDFDIWVPAGFHILMNGYWEVFAVSDSALGPMSANISRLVVIILSVVMTLLYAKRRGGLCKLMVTGRAWFWGGPR